jgi:hypothetical protein
MTYASIASIVDSGSLRRRILAAAAQENVPNAELWVTQNIWKIAAEPGWAEAWDYATANSTLDDNPDTGARPGVINDEMILTAIQALNV